MNLFTIVCKNHQKISKQRFCILFTPNRFKLRPGEFINVNMKLLVRIPEQIIAACVLLPTLDKNGLRMASNQYISADNNICNTNLPINLPWKVHFDLVNRSTNTVFSICKKQELCFLTTLNKGMEELKVKYTKT